MESRIPSALESQTLSLISMSATKPKGGCRVWCNQLQCSELAVYIIEQGTYDGYGVRKKTINSPKSPKRDPCVNSNPWAVTKLAPGRKYEPWSWRINHPCTSNEGRTDNNTAHTNKKIQEIRIVSPKDSKIAMHALPDPVTVLFLMMPMSEERWSMMPCSLLSYTTLF